MRSNKKKRTANTQIISSKAPFTFVEAYKSLRTNLQFVSISNQYKKIIVTSSVPFEGKSTVAINMALSLVDSGNKVLLIDSDLRKPMIQKYLHLSAVKGGGLTNILANTEKAEQCIYFLSDTGLNVITSGPIPPNPAEMLGSKRMEELVKDLESKFDYIIFDTPPVSVVTDAAVLSKFCDGVILVIKQKFATRESAQLAKRNLENVGANIIGCVINEFKAEQSSKSYAYYHYKKYDYTYK
jgi:capsular exopolysaccharide synthesis family protein